MIFCQLRTADKKDVGTINLEGMPPLGYSVEFNGNEYRIKAGCLLKQNATAEIQHHVIDGLILTVELVETPKEIVP